MRAINEERILRRSPTQISWCVRCVQETCSGNCDSVLFETEAATLRGDTPVAAPVEEGYSSSETVRAREVLYSPALLRKIETRTKAIQTRRSQTRNRATQTEAEAIPPHALPSVRRIAYLILFLAAASLVLAGLAAIPGAQARPLTATEHLPSSSAGLLRAAVSISLIVIISKYLVTRVTAAVTGVPELPEPTTAGATAFVAAIAAGYLLVRKPRPETEESVEVVDETARTSENWEPFLRDISAPKFTGWKAGLINERHSKNVLRNAILALYARLQASLDLGKRQGEFIAFLNANPPGHDILARLCTAVGKEEGDWQGAVEKAERWCKYAETTQQRIWPLFPNVLEGEQTVNKLYQQIDELCRLRHTIVRNATGYVFAHGSSVNTGKIEDLQHWVDAAPREFEKDVAALFVPRPTTKQEIIDRIEKLIAGENNECTHPQELARAMRNDDATEWTESLQGIRNLIALTSIVTRPWSAVLTHFARLVKPTEGNEKLEKENTDLREKLDDALIRLELLKGTNGGGHQKYSVPLFDTCFTDVCSWNTWRN